MKKTVWIRPILLLLGLSLLVSSCATSPKRETATNDQFEADNSGATAPFNLLANGKRTTIAGSANIDKDGRHKSKTYFLYGAETIQLDNYYFDIPVVYNTKVKQWIDYFLNRGRDFFESYSARAGRYAPVMGKILEDSGLPRDLIFLAMAESGFQTNAKSWARAVGPWQFMPYTAKKFGLKIDWYIDERRDPIKSTIAATRYLGKLYDDFGSWELAAAAYNAGEGKIGRAIRRYQTENFWNLMKGRYLKSETKNYVPKIMALAILGKNLKSFGLEDIDFHEPLDFDEISVPPMTDVMQVAQALDVEFEELERLNPEVLRWYTPPVGESYPLRIPVGKKAEWMNCCSGRDFSAKDFQTYIVSRGGATTLTGIAKRFKVAPYVLTDLNQGPSVDQRLSTGTELKLPFKVGQSRRENMYADLYERPRKEILLRQAYRSRIHQASKHGKRITAPMEYYTVQKGDTLWTVSQKTGVPLDTIIISNMEIIKNRMIRAGDKLVVR
jgi:membrane-bound lytic murein transglycosylase D